MTIPRDGDTIPVAVETRYSRDAPSASTELYRGELEVVRTAGTDAATGVVHLDWNPRPAIIATLLQPGFVGLHDQIAVRIPGTTLAVPVLGCRSSGVDYEGHIEEFRVGRHDALTGSVLFNLPNFPWIVRGRPVRIGGLHRYLRGRVVVEGAGWRITLDPARHCSMELVKQLKATEGHAITYVGELRRIDGTSFTSVEADIVLNGLCFLFTIARGGWTGPTLVQGLANDGEVLWETWGVPSVDPLTVPWSMMSSTEEVLLKGVFPVFLARWQDPVWQSALVAHASLYRAANTLVVGIEASLVPAQAALELLVWMGRTTTASRPTSSAPRPNSAAGRIATLLECARVPLGIPTTFPALLSAAQARNWPDGPTAIAALRNAVTHPSAAKLEMIRGVDVDARYEALQLALWYLDLLFLWFMDYEGAYASRASDARWSGQEVRQVPWVNQP